MADRYASDMDQEESGPEIRVKGRGIEIGAAQGPQSDESGMMEDDDKHGMGTALNGRPRRMHVEVLGPDNDSPTVTTAAEVQRLRNLLQDAREAFIRALVTANVGVQESTAIVDLARTVQYLVEKQRSALLAQSELIRELENEKTDLIEDVSALDQELADVEFDLEEERSSANILSSQLDEMVDENDMLEQAYEEASFWLEVWERVARQAFTKLSSAVFDLLVMNTEEEVRNTVDVDEWTD